MKRILFTLIVAFSYICCCAQDSNKIIYGEEKDTLTKQRFIDRYENVFMTKVPTRHMFKVGISQYYKTIPYPLIDDAFLNSTALMVSYEFKFLPSFSVAFSGAIPYLGLDYPLQTSWQTIALNAQLRWYYDMKKRIKRGKSANNFSGNYIAVDYNRPKGPAENSPSIGLKFGFQRRFLNYGFMDFSMLLKQESPWFHYGAFDNWSFSSQAVFGLAIGDWKRSQAFPLCDVLLCNEQITQQWKIRLPDLNFGYYLNRIVFGAGFERKLGATPFSLNFQYNIGVNKGFDYMKNRGYSRYEPGNGTALAISRELSQSLSIQPRYYFLQERQKLIGKGGNGLSGVYAGINTEYNLYFGRHGFGPFGDNIVHIKQSQIRTGPLIGFQQRLFRHGYVDLSASYNYEKDLNSANSSLALRSDVSVGFAF